MAKFNKFQVLMLLVLVPLLIMTPFLPSSLKSAFIYLIVNVLIFWLGAEAGFHKAFPRSSSSSEDTKFSASVVSIPERKVGSTTSDCGSGCASFSELSEKRKPNKIVVEMFDKVKKSDSIPSLGLVEGSEAEGMEEVKGVAEGEEEVAGINGQELITKADAFISNFYKELKMQREEDSMSIILV